jgi:hypothetical protein
MKRQPFSIYCEKFRLGLQRCPSPNARPLKYKWAQRVERVQWRLISVMQLPVRERLDADASQFRQTVPSGPLNSKWFHPFGGVDHHFGKGWTVKAYWGYYGYHEDPSPVVQDAFAACNFRGNLVTLSVRYAF